MNALIALLFFPSGLFVMLNGLAYEWVDRKLVAQMQNRIGPRWFQPLADVVKLLAKEEVVPHGVDARWFHALPIVALAATLTAVLYLPLMGLTPLFSFSGDLIVTIYLLSMVTLCLTLAGSLAADRFALIGSTRTLTQLFSYEAPFMLALLGPAVVAGSWQIDTINSYAGPHWLIVTQPIGFVIAVIGLMGKLELPPFDAPEAHTEIVAGALTEYSGRGLALFQLAKNVTLIAGLTLIASFYLGGIANVFDFVGKTLALLLIVTILQALFARLRIDQVVGVWWRVGALLVLVQWLVLIVVNEIAGK